MLLAVLALACQQTPVQSPDAGAHGLALSTGPDRPAVPWMVGPPTTADVGTPLVLDVPMQSLRCRGRPARSPRGTQYTGKMTITVDEAKFTFSALLQHNWPTFGRLVTSMWACRVKRGPSSTSTQAPAPVELPSYLNLSSEDIDALLAGGWYFDMTALQSPADPYMRCQVLNLERDALRHDAERCRGDLRLDRLHFLRTRAQPGTNGYRYDLLSDSPIQSATLVDLDGGTVATIVGGADAVTPDGGANNGVVTTGVGALTTEQEPALTSGQLQSTRRLAVQASN